MRFWSKDDLRSVAVDWVEGPRGQEPPHHGSQTHPEKRIMDGKPNRTGISFFANRADSVRDTFEKLARQVKLTS